MTISKQDRDQKVDLVIESGVLVVQVSRMASIPDPVVVQTLADGLLDHGVKPEVANELLARTVAHCMIKLHDVREEVQELRDKLEDR